MGSFGVKNVIILNPIHNIFIFRDAKVFIFIFYEKKRRKANGLYHHLNIRWYTIARQSEGIIVTQWSNLNQNLIVNTIYGHV